MLARGAGLGVAMLAYAPLLDSPTLTLLKYEHYIFRKSALIALVAERFGSAGEPRARGADPRLGRLAAWTSMNPKAFVRRVTPGDHKEKLKPETIARLNEILAPTLELFDYPVEA